MADMISATVMKYRFTAQKQFVADGGGKVVFPGARLAAKDEAGDIAVKFIHVLTCGGERVHLPAGLNL
jgi:hypothetical protein